MSRNPAIRRRGVRTWLAQHRQALGLTLHGLLRAPLASLFNIVVIGIALSLPLLLYVLLVNAQALVGTFAPQPQISIYLATEAPPSAIKDIAGRLRQHAGIATFRHVPREQALQEMQRSMGVSDLLSGLARNPLPEAFVVDARPVSTPELEALRAEFSRWPAVAHVQLDSEWAQRLESVLALARMAVLMMVILLAVALVAVTFNTIRLQILTRREEIEVSQLIGATAAFIRRPFLYYGTLVGLAGGLLAWLIVWAELAALNDGLVGLALLYGLPLELRHLAPSDSATTLLFAAALGWAGAWLSVARHLARQGV